MIPILDWIFEGIVGWVASIVSQLFDAVSGLFLEALGTDMTAMEEYFPFVTKAYDVMQVTAWAILILITVWQLFRAFGGPITEAENPWHLVVRGAIFAFLIGYAKPIFSACLSIARAPYTSLMDLSMTGEDFTFAGVEQALTSGLTTIVSVASVVGIILIMILEIALGWNYFKLLLETVARYIVVGVLCYTSPLAFSLGGSKATNTVFRSWCRMVGSQLLLLVMNVWFLRGFASSMGQFIGNGGALSNGKGSIFLWMFCALAYLKCAQRFDSYLASMGLNVAQTGSSLGMELMMAARVITGVGSGARSAGSVFSRAGGGAVATGTGAAATGFAAGFASRFNPNSYVRDAVVEGGQRMGFSGGAGFVGRAFGGIAARNGATLNSNSISSVATRPPNVSGAIGGEIADRSLGNYMPHMQGFQLQGTQITGGHISTTAVGADGKKSSVDMFNAAQYEKPDVPHSVVTAADGSQWYQMASGEGRGAFYDAPVFNGAGADIPSTPAGGTDSAVGGDSGMSFGNETGQSVGDSFTHEGVDGHPGMAAYPGASEDGGMPDAPAPEGTVLTGDATDGQPHIVPFPGADGGTVVGEQDGAVLTGDNMEVPGMAAFSGPTGGAPNSESIQDGTTLTGDGMDMPPGMVAFPGSTEGMSGGEGIHEGTTLMGDGMDMPPGMVAFPGSAESLPVTEGIQEGGALNGDGVDGHPGMATFPAGEDQQMPGFTPGDGGVMPAGTVLDTSGEAPQFGAPPGDELNIPGTTVVTGAGEGVPGVSAQPAGGTFHEDGADAQHFGGAFVGGSQMPYGDGSHFQGGAEGTHYGDGHDAGGEHHGVYSEAPLVAATFPSAPEGTSLRTVGDGVIEASSPDGGNTLWYNSAYFQEPDAPHTVMQSANGVDWYAMQQHGSIPQFETGDAAAAYNQAAFQNFMPGYDLPVAQVDGQHRQDGHFEVRHEDGSGTRFYDTTRFAAPRGDYQVFEDARGAQWYAIRGEAAVDRKPVYENGKPVYDEGKLRTINVETVRYKQTPARFAEPEKRGDIERKPPRRKM